MLPELVLLPTLLLYAKVELATSHPAISDIFDLGELKPLDPWRELMVGENPRMLFVRPANPLLTFDVALTSDWTGFSLYERQDFSLALIQNLGHSLNVSTCVAAITRIEVAPAEGSMWAGNVIFSLSHLWRVDTTVALTRMAVA